MSDEKLPNINKIAVLRANALGDFIFALPALNALRSTYPEAEIVLLARSWHQPFLESRPGPINRVIVIPEGGIGNESEVNQYPAELAVFLNAMQEEKFDLAIQMHGGGRNSNPFTLQLGAKMTIGLRTPDAPELDRWIPYIYFQSEILRYLELVSLVGAKTSELEPQLIVTESDLLESEKVLPKTNNDLVVLHPGATAVQRRWPVEKFAAVGDALVAAGADIVVTGTAPEKELVKGVVDSMKAEAIDVCDRLSLNGLTGLLSRSKVVISNDSGPLHLAAAVGAATVGIYWCGNLITAGGTTRTFHRPIVSWCLNCPVCDRECIYNPCNHQVSFVADISTQEVIDTAVDLLEMRSRS